MGKFIITNGSNREHQFSLSAANRKVIMSSEVYTTNLGCENGIESVSKECTGIDEI